MLGKQQTSREKFTIVRSMTKREQIDKMLNRECVRVRWYLVTVEGCVCYTVLLARDLQHFATTRKATRQQKGILTRKHALGFSQLRRAICEAGVLGRIESLECKGWKILERTKYRMEK